MTDYSALISEALADVEAGIQHPCGTTPTCRAAGGCPRCFQAVLRGIDVARVDVFAETGIVRFTMDEGCGKPQPCVVSFNVPLEIHE